MEATVLNLAGSDNFYTQEAYKSLRTNLMFCGRDVQIVALTSYWENEGKTTVVLNLAKSLAELGKRVLVIDADMRKSVIAGRHARVKNPAGLSEILTGIVKLSDGLYTTQYDNLHMIFSGKYPPNPAELLGGKYFPLLLEETRKVYDYVLIDTPPLGQVIDAAILAPSCDGVLLVMDSKSIRVKNSRSVINQLKKGGIKILGVVRNHVPDTKTRYKR